MNTQPAPPAWAVEAAKSIDSRFIEAILDGKRIQEGETAAIIAKHAPTGAALGEADPDGLIKTYQSQLIACRAQKEKAESELTALKAQMADEESLIHLLRQHYDARTKEHIAAVKALIAMLLTPPDAPAAARVEEEKP